MGQDRQAREAVEQARSDLDKLDKPTEGALPAAGPHAKKALTDEAKTPGSGALPENDDKSVMPGSG
ncbi:MULTISPECIES: hypothetical protein [unclassified Rhizobium]|uniref:hypothetical protein n=1 Tax=unclassified Rhizobium TaxID=2613769 RepID=UPI0016095699|nr:MULTISPECIES: hypothetical protein [unclassified Rhizobium]MBB3444345.1 hypothetical protein [Rhizobium sp. BK379]MBB3564518.1 hypothetical protein [Rhizobium sp. BK512]